MPIKISSLLARDRKFNMEASSKQEALLRHLLSKKNNEADDEFVYSFLLGSRLFLSPYQLLTELHRLSTEDVARMQDLAETMCSKCRQIHIDSQTLPNSIATKTYKNNTKTDVSASTSTEATAICKGTDFRSPNSNSSPSDDEVFDSEDAIPHRKRNKIQNSTEKSESTVLSAFIELEDSSNNNSNDNELVTDNGLPASCSICGASLVRKRQSSFEQQLLHILHIWVRHFPADFRKEEMMWTLNDVIKTCQSENKGLSRIGEKILDCISRRTTTQESYEQHLSNMEYVTASEQLRKKDWMVNFLLNLKDATDVNKMAHQLCLIETNFLKHVGSEEFLQLFAPNGHEDVRTNLGACVRWFNRLSHLVATNICMSRKRKDGRHIITFYARVADRCFELSNFNSSMAILTGLSLGPVTRLHKMWNKLALSELSKLQGIFDPTNNFLTYRSIYASCVEKLQSPLEPRAGEEEMHRSSINSRRSLPSITSIASQQGNSGVECGHDTPKQGCKTPSCLGRLLKKNIAFNSQGVKNKTAIVPFLVLLVKDVYFLNHANQTVDESGNINIEKLQNLSTILRPLEFWKHMAPAYYKNEEIQDFLLRSPVHDDEDLYLLSYKREAPINRFEKQQLKSLKAERALKKQNDAAPVVTKSFRPKTV